MNKSKIMLLFVLFFIINWDFYRVVIRDTVLLIMSNVFTNLKPEGNFTILLPNVTAYFVATSCTGIYQSYFGATSTFLFDTKKQNHYAIYIFILFMVLDIFRICFIVYFHYVPFNLTHNLIGEVIMYIPFPIIYFKLYKIRQNEHILITEKLEYTTWNLAN